MDNGKKNIDFKFSRNWKTFMNWYNGYMEKAKCAPRWEDQIKKIESAFEPSNPGIVDWKLLWKNFAIWFSATYEKNSIILWDEQKRQIETLMLGQLSELNKEQFILAYLYRGKPAVDSSAMTYWDALRTKQNLSGDSNGFGGDERMDKITIVNINTLIG